LDRAAVKGRGSASSSRPLHKAALSPDIVALLPEPTLIVKVLSEVVMHESVSIESAAAVMSLIAALLKR
jgi:hypothetical protein